MAIKNRSASSCVAAMMVILSGSVPEPAPSSATGVTPTQIPGAPNPTHVLEPFDTRIRIGDGMLLVYVPAGQFEMGSSDDERARPVHMVALDAFWIDQTEVTNAMFAAFLNEQGNQVEEGVSWLEPGAGHRLARRFEGLCGRPGIAIHITRCTPQTGQQLSLF